MSFWDGTPFPGNLAWCKNAYWYLEKTEPDANAISYTVVLIICTVWLELLVHAGVDTVRKSEPKQDEENTTTTHEIATPMVDLQPPSGNDASRWSTDTLQHSSPPTTSATAEVTNRPWFCVAPANPAVRGTRLLLGFFFYQAAAGTFAFRMSDLAYRPRLEYGCERYIQIPPPNWWAVVFLNIIPFICATSAFLRILTDLALLKRGTGLHYDWRAMRDGKGCAWLPCMPIVVVGAAMGVIVWWVIEGGRVSGRYLRGEKKSAVLIGKRMGQEVEMQGDEEGQGLLDGAEDGEENEESESIEDDEVHTTLRGK